MELDVNRKSRLDPKAQAALRLIKRGHERTIWLYLEEPIKAARKSVKK
jgi:hypothetical protein